MRYYDEDDACDTTCSSNLYLGAGCDCGMRTARLEREADECERRGLFDAEHHTPPFLPEPDPEEPEIAKAVAFVASAKERRRVQ